MTNKTLNTRVLLRYDEYTNWYNNNPKLLKGEIAIATIPENHTDPSTGAITQIPAVVIKVGTGAATGSNYRDLPFISAKAADVLAACKSEEGLRTFINGVIADAGIATDEALTSLANRVTALDKETDGRVALVEGKASANETAIGVLNGNDETAGSVAKAIKDAITALNLGTMAVEAATDYIKKTEASGYDDILTKTTAGTTYETIANVALTKEALETKIGEVEEAITAYATKTELTAETERATAAEAKALEDAKKYTDEVKKAILTGDTEKELKEAYDTLVEIQEWIEGAGVNVTELTEAIAAEAKAREEADKAQDEVIKTLATKEELGNYTNTENLTILLAGKQDTIPEGTYATPANVATAKGEAIQEAQNKIDALVNGGQVKTNTDAIAAINETLDGYGNIVTYNKADFATYEQGILAESALQRVWTTENGGLKVTYNGQIDIDETIEFIFDCGNSTVRN